jgi:hypothetical protein
VIKSAISSTNNIIRGAIVGQIRGVDLQDAIGSSADDGYPAVDID